MKIAIQIQEKVQKFLRKNNSHHVVEILQDWDCTGPNLGLHNTTRGRLLAQASFLLSEIAWRIVQKDISNKIALLFLATKKYPLS